MKTTLRPKPACAAADRRGVLTLSRSLVCVLSWILVAGCSGRGDHPSSESQGRENESAPPAPSKPEGTVELKADVQRTLHLQVEPLSAASAAPEMAGYGRVLDPTPLAAAVSEWATARAGAAASEQEFERVKMLQRQNTASVRVLQSAEAAAVRDRLLVESIRDRIALSWGHTLSRRADLIGLVRVLTSQERAIVRVELPVGEEPSAPPQAARLSALTEPQKTINAEFVGPAPATDPQLQGRGFLLLTQDNSLNLTPGAAVSASLKLGGNELRGVLLPGSALVRYDTRNWVYLQKDATTFARTPVALGPPLPGGWLVTHGLRAADRAVTLGAQVLLSEELKPQNGLPD